MVILDEDFPSPHRLAVPVAPPRSPIDNGGSLLTFSVDVNTGVKGIFENRDDVAIADRQPGKAGHAAFVRRSREVDLIGLHRQQHLTRAAQLSEARKDEPDYLLKA